MPENMYNCLYDRRRLIFFLVNGLWKPTRRWFVKTNLVKTNAKV